MKKYNPKLIYICEHVYCAQMAEAKDGEYFRVKDVVERVKELTGFETDGLKGFTKRFIAAHQRKTG